MNSLKDGPLQKMPALFVGHGSPMNIIADNSFTKNFQLIAAKVPRPTSILCVSAHWITPGTQVLKVDQPRQIYDFYGFPEELYQIKYSPPGSPEIAAKIASQVSEIQTTETWGLDHGAWSVLHHMYPDFSIPTFQLSLNQSLKPFEHLELARKLDFLRTKGVLILSSGNIVHNLNQIKWEPQSTPHSWALDFDEFVLKTLSDPNTESDEKIETIFNSPGLKRAHPTLEHLIPLIYTIALSENSILLPFSRGIQNASISMSSFTTHAL